MTSINITELRKHLPEYVRKASRGEKIQITSRGKVVACLTADHRDRDQALQRLKQSRGTVIQGDIESPLESTWMSDADNL